MGERAVVPAAEFDLRIRGGSRLPALSVLCLFFGEEDF